MLYDIVTVFWRDWLVLKRHLAKFILARTVAPLLYLVALGWGLGRSIDIGGSYLDFLVPGILALNSMNISFNSVTPLHAERVYHRSLEEYLLAPISPAAFLIGKLLAALLRSLVSGGIIVLLSLVFGAHISLNPATVLVLTINSFIFAEMGFFAAMKVNTYEEMSRVNTYLLLPMSFLCGTFFKVETLPFLARLVVEILPLTQATSLLRTLMGGGNFLWLPMAVLLLYGAAGFFLCLRAFMKESR